MALRIWITQRTSHTEWIRDNLSFKDFYALLLRIRHLVLGHFESMVFDNPLWMIDSYTIFSRNDGLRTIEHIASIIPSLLHMVVDNCLESGVGYAIYC